MQQRIARILSIFQAAIVGLACASAGSALGATPVQLLGAYEDQSGPSTGPGAPTTCNNTTICTAYFSTLQTAVRITKVSCFISTTVGAGLAKLSLGHGNRDTLSYKEWQYLGPYDYTSATSSNSTFEFLADTDHALAAGTTPAVSITTVQNSVTSISCSLTGSTS